jgi:hypothetical protein
MTEAAIAAADVDAVNPCSCQVSARILDDVLIKVDGHDVTAGTAGDLIAPAATRPLTSSLTPGCTATVAMMPLALPLRPDQAQGVLSTSA